MGEKLPVPVFLDNMQGHIYKKRATGGVLPVSSSFSAPRIPYARACPAPFSSAFLSGHRAHAAGSGQELPSGSSSSLLLPVRVFPVHGQAARFCRAFSEVCLMADLHVFRPEAGRRMTLGNVADARLVLGFAPMRPFFRARATALCSL